MSLKKKFFLFFAVIFSVNALFAVLYFKQSLEEQLKNITSDSMERSLRGFSSGIVDDLIVEDVAKLETFVKKAAALDSNIINITVTEESGKALASWDKPISHTEASRFEKHQYEVVHQGELFGRVIITYDLTTPQKSISNRITTWTLALITLLIFTTLLMWVVFENYLLKPLLHINQCIKDLSSNKKLDFSRFGNQTDELRSIMGSLLRHQELLHEKSTYQKRLIIERDKFESASQAKTEFVSSISHELRTPLNAITGFSELISMKTETQSKVHRYANEIYISAKHLTSLINDVLDLAKVESGKLEINYEKIDFDQQLQASISILQPLASEKSIRIVTSSFNTKTEVLADSLKLRQVLINLIGNAIKFSPPKSPVHILTTSDAGLLRVEIHDQGIGISDQDQKRVFESFTKVGDSELHQGTGLGLALSKALVTKMGGEIGVISALAEGSTFWFNIPLCEYNSNGAELTSELPDDL
ncbi:sensor histidine kinase [Methylophaga sp.]|uniref:sensor histidine kinase n=1 Tax=Methylophaga sp. TaxID=2024840 RepID=UPI003F69A247